MLGASLACPVCDSGVAAAAAAAVTLDFVFPLDGTVWKGRNSMPNMKGFRASGTRTPSRV